MADGILIIGGYGAVGTVIASQLARQYGEQVIIAGRNATRAATLASELQVRWRVVDVANPLDYEAVFEGVSYVVMCLDVPNMEFVRQSFEHGIHYVDISAEYPILSAIANLDQIAQQHRATAVLSVGLVPGLSNLLARHSLHYVNPIQRFDTAILAGLGEKHGVAGSSWILDHMSDSSGMNRFDFREPYGRKTVHRFAFSDQYTLPETLPMGEAATWLGFDTFVMTQLITLARLPILRWLFRQNAVKQLLLSTTQRMQFGTDEFVLTTRAQGNTKSYQAWLRGKRETLATGIVTAEVIRRLLTERFPAGVYHIEQIFEFENFLPVLQQHGMTFSSTASRQPLYVIG